MGPLVVKRATRLRRQHGQQGTRRRRDRVLPGVHRWRAVLGGRRPRAARRRRGVPDRHRDRALGHARACLAQGHEACAAAGGEGRCLDHHGLRRGSRRCRQASAARHDQADRRAQWAIRAGCLYALLDRGRPARDPDRRRQQGHPLRAGQVKTAVEAVARPAMRRAAL